jgi:hypothetical protein
MSPYAAAAVWLRASGPLAWPVGAAVGAGAAVVEVVEVVEVVVAHRPAAARR